MQFFCRYELPDKVGTSGLCSLSVYLKEVKSKNNYGYGSMFGVPFILQVPREGLNYDQLYQLIFDRMKRFMKSSSDLNEGNSNTSNQYEEMDIGGKVPDVENGNELPSMETNGLEDEPNQKKQLFTLDLVNSSGNSSIGRLKNNNKPITLGGKAQPYS